MKNKIKYIEIFLLIIIIGMITLVLVSSFPSSWIEKNVKISSETLLKEGNKKIYFSLSHLQYLEFDNYTDALMINTAYSIDSKTPLYSIFSARKNYIPGVTKKILQDYVGDLSSNTNKYDELSQVEELYDTAHGDAPESYEYGRYWHGYMIFLRPLLIFFNYWQIRFLLMLVLAILAIRFLTILENRFGKYVCFVFLLALFELDYFYIGLSIFNTPIAIIMMVFGIFLLKRFEKIKDMGLVFFTVGCLIGFFDLLDYPLITYEMGILIYLLCMIQKRNYKADIKSDFISMIKFGILWILGYALTWLAKWILADLIYHKNLLRIGISQIIFRSSNYVMWGDKIINISPALAISFNILYMGAPIMFNIILCIMIMCSKSIKFSKDNIKLTISFIICSLIPFVWLGIFTNHSFQHAFFTCRILFSTLIVLLLIPSILTSFYIKSEGNLDGKS